MIFSYSSARAINDHPRNVSDAVLKLVAADAAAERTRLNAPPHGDLDIGQPDKATDDFTT